MERETHSHKGWYLKYRNNDWKKERAGRHDGATECTVDILRLQETKWKESKARKLGGGCKLFYNRPDERKNGIKIELREELVESVLEVKRVPNRLMPIKLEVKESILNIVSANAPQVNNNL